MIKKYFKIENFKKFKWNFVYIFFSLFVALIKYMNNVSDFLHEITIFEYFKCMCCSFCMKYVCVLTEFTSDARTSLLRKLPSIQWQNT